MCADSLRCISWGNTETDSNPVPLQPWTSHVKDWVYFPCCSRAYIVALVYQKSTRITLVVPSYKGWLLIVNIPLFLTV